MAVATAISPRLSARPLLPNASRMASAFSTDWLYRGSLFLGAVLAPGRGVGADDFAAPTNFLLAAMTMAASLPSRCAPHHSVAFSWAMYLSPCSCALLYAGRSVIRAR